MTIKNFDFGVRCSGFPVDHQFAVRPDSCCVIVAIEDALKRHKIQIRGFSKIFIDFEPRIEGGLRVVSDAIGVMWISWPFNCGEYFSAEPERRIRILGMTCIAAIQELFRIRQLSTELLDQALSEVQNANFQAEPPLGTKVRSPDKRRWASLSYKASLDDCTVFLAITERGGKTILKEVVVKQPPIFGFCVTLCDKSVEWISNDVVQVTLTVSRKETIVRNFVIPTVGK